MFTKLKNIPGIIKIAIAVLISVVLLLFALAPGFVKFAAFTLGFLFTFIFVIFSIIRSIWLIGMYLSGNEQQREWIAQQKFFGL